MKKYVRASNGTWNDAYHIFEILIDMFLDEGEDAVNSAVDKVYSEFKGNPAFDEAYRRFNNEM